MDSTYQKESKALEDQQLIPKNSGYRYKSDDVADMIECHVDSLSLFQDKMSTTEFEGNLSVILKEGERLTLSFGHDECIYKQYLLTKKAWTLPSGEKKWFQK
jgi:hypothetical protein